MESKILLQELREQTRDHLRQLQELKSTPDSELRSKPGEKSWNALECCEHLNRYMEFYLPKFQEIVSKASEDVPETFNPGFIGNFMVNAVTPSAKTLKMKTAPSKNPLGDALSMEVISELVDYLDAFLMVLEKAAHVDLNSGRLKTTLPLIRMNFGDALRFNAAHNGRHLQQAFRAIKS